MSAVVTRVTIEASPAQLPPEGGTARITLEAQASGTAASKVVMKLSSTGGELSAAEVTTDDSGRAEFAWTGTKTSSVIVRSGAYSGYITLNVPAPAVSSPPPTHPPTPPPPPPPDPLLSLTATPAAIAPGQTVTLTATPANLAADETVTSYRWDFDGNETVDATSTIPWQVTSPFNSVGSFSPRVTTTTSQGRTLTGSTSVTVALPTLAVRVAGQSTNVDPGVPQTYTATVTGLALFETVIGFEWTFDATNTGTSVGPTKDFAYSTYGTKTVKVKAMTSTGRTAIGETTVVVPGP